MSSNGINLTIAGLLILMLISVLTVAGLIFLFVLHTRTAQSSAPNSDRPRDAEDKAADRAVGSILDLLGYWLVIPSTNLDAVGQALGLHNAVRCSWSEAIARHHDDSLFISAAFRGWTLVVGRGLPNPLDDPDRCFHFMARLSHEFGEAQFFTANKALGHHGWVRARRGKVVRGYCWAGETVWNQGAMTDAERRVGMQCLGYGEPQNENASWAGELPPANSDRIPQLAAAWSFDPGSGEAEALWEAGCVMGQLIASTSQ